MLRISPPSCTFAKSIDDCIAGMSRLAGGIRDRVVAGREPLLASGKGYLDAAAGPGGLSTIPAFIGDEADLVVDRIIKSDLHKMYDNYFVPERKIARKIYDEIMAGSAERCPYCGGIGRPRNLDHFLPKAHFPQFAVLPVNLVPICRDCNFDGKGDRFARAPEELSIHPYIDDRKFFEQQWIFARYHANHAPIGHVEYYVSAPEDWPDVDKARAQNHFGYFCIAGRYSIKAAEQLNSLISQIGIMKGLDISANDIERILMQAVVHSTGVNNWRRCMHQALIAAVKAGQIG